MLQTYASEIETLGLNARVQRLSNIRELLIEEFFDRPLPFAGIHSGNCPACGKKQPMPHEKPHYRKMLNHSSTIGIYDCAGIWIQTPQTLQTQLRDARDRASGRCTREHKERSMDSDNGMWG